MHSTWIFCVVFIGSCMDKSISVSAGVTSNIEYLQVYMNAYDTLHMVFQVVMGCHDVMAFQAALMDLECTWHWILTFGPTWGACGGRSSPPDGWSAAGDCTLGRSWRLRIHADTWCKTVRSKAGTVVGTDQVGFVFFVQIKYIFVAYLQSRCMSFACCEGCVLWMKRRLWKCAQHCSCWQQQDESPSGIHGISCTSVLCQGTGSITSWS